MNKSIPLRKISALLCLASSAVLLCTVPANAVLVTGPSDPAASIMFQGANALTFQSLGYTIGTGPTDLKVYTNTWTDPSGLIFGTIVPGLDNSVGWGTTTNKLTYAYTSYGTSIPNGNQRDYDWIMNNANNLTPNNTSLDMPWLGTIWDLAGPANQAVVFPIIDHGPLPDEAVEYTVYLTNKPTSTNLADWNLAVLDSVYLEGWEPDLTALADGFTTVWKLPSAATFQYVSVSAMGSQAIYPGVGNEDEIDAVAGLTADGDAVSPEPGSLVLLGVGVISLLACAWRRRQAA
jgi:hypothetical protein